MKEVIEELTGANGSLMDESDDPVVVILRGIHGLATRFQEAGDPEEEAQLRVWQVLRRGFPFSRLEELGRDQYKQVIAFLEKFAREASVNQQAPALSWLTSGDRTGLVDEKGRSST